MCGLVPHSSPKESVIRSGLVASLLLTYKTKVTADLLTINYQSAVTFILLISQTDRCDIEDSLIKSLIDVDNIVKSNATHVVVGIDWGSCSVLSVTGSDDASHTVDELKVRRFCENVVLFISSVLFTLI